jgi:hypothetical protein
MKTRFLLVGLATLMLAAGCISSLNPLYTDSDLVFDGALVGTWIQDNSAGKWDVLKRDEKSYRLVYTDKDGKHGQFVGRLAKIQGSLFLDVCPEDVDAESSGLTKFHWAPMHTIYLVRRTEPVLQLAVVNLKQFEQYLENHPDEIAFATFNGRKLITAPTKDVQGFVLRHKEFFTGNIEFRRAGN